MPTLYMIKLGATPKGRLIEQHDIFFGIADHVSDLIPAINAHWQEVKDKWHIDAYRPVTKVGDYHISWSPSASADESDQDVSTSTNADAELKLYFINLGGYLAGDFEEYHHKMLIVAPTQADAIKQAKQSDFYQRYSFDDDATPFNAASHIDDKMQVDIDDIYDVNGLLSEAQPAGRLIITPIKAGKADTQASNLKEDKQYIGYLSISKLKKLAG